MSTGQRTTRRAILRYALPTAASVAGALMAPSGSAMYADGQTPQRRGSTLVVPFQLYFPFTFTSTNQHLVQAFVDQYFNARHKGVRALWQPGGGMDTVVTTLLAGGEVPWVVASCCGDWPIIAPFLEPLDPFFQRDNISPTKLWTPNQLAQFQTPFGLLAVPEDAASQAYLYRQDVLDQLGLEYPDPDWSYRDAERIWSACTGTTSGQHRYGATLPWNPGGPFPGLALFYGFGGALMSSDHTRCLLDTPSSLAAGEWAFPLIWDGIVTGGDGTPVQGLANGTVVFSQGADPSLLWAVLNLRGVKWDFLPYPRWPVRLATVFQSNFYGLMSDLPNEELAWELFRFAAVDPAWSRYYMRLTMAPPGLNALLEEWVALVRQVAPALRTKALEYWVEPTLSDYAYDAFAFFKYQPSQAQQVISSTWTSIWNRQMSVSEGFRQITQQVNAIQASGAVEQTAVQKEQIRITQALTAAERSPRSVDLPSPSRTGIGGPPSPDSGQVSFSKTGWMVVGGGGGTGSIINGVTFAGAAVPSSRATFTCRLTLFAPVKPPQTMPPGAACGLMVRGNLSDDAPSLGLEVAYGNGIQMHVQPAAGLPPAIQAAGSSPGLLAATQILTPHAKPGTNNLLRPVWLRLVRDVAQWTAYTSLDGVTWVQAGHPVGALIAGAWIGLYVTAGSPGDLVKAGFDHVEGFTPNAFVRIGAP